MATAQNCNSCHNWSENIYNAYISGDYDFKYVSMIVFDENGHILNNEAFNWSYNYNIMSFPTSIFDGDFQRITGNHIDQLNDTLNACGNRTVANITGNVSMTWLENSSINVSISIQNNEETQYNGHIEAFINEYTSRYKTSGGVPYHFGFLNFAFHENVLINASENYSNYIIWNGSEHYDEHGNNFSDIKQNNIEVTLVIYNSSSGYVDETVFFIFPNTAPDPPFDPYPIDGETGVNLNTNLTWNCSDADEDILRYDVYFGTTNPPPLVGTNLTNTSYEPGTLLLETTYYWKIVARDIREATNESPIWNFTTRINNKPNEPVKPNGLTKGEEGQELEYSTSAIDPDGDDLFYWFDWGDESSSGWFGPYPSGKQINITHVWIHSGEYKIKVKTKDIFDAESNWSDSLNITIIEPLIQIINITGGGI